MIEILQHSWFYVSQALVTSINKAGSFCFPTTPIEFKNPSEAAIEVTCFKGPKIPTFRGCRRCVVWSGRPSRWMLLAMASYIRGREMWLSWLSIANRTGRFDPQCGMKVCSNNFMNSSVSMYPLSDVPYAHSEETPSVKFLWGMDFSKNTKEDWNLFLMHSSKNYVCLISCNLIAHLSNRSHSPMI